MGSHIIDILRQGIWASLTGGWFYDPHQSIFSNTFHLYLWMALLVFPLILHLTVETSIVLWGIYCGIIGVVFTVIKVFNFKLHHMYDTSEVIEEPSEKGDKNGSENDSKVIEICSAEKEIENIEMVQLNQQASVNQISEVASLPNGEDNGEDKKNEDDDDRKRKAKNGMKIEGRENGKRPKTNGPAPLAELETDDIDQTPKKKDQNQDLQSLACVKGTDSSLDEETQTSSHQITTTAEVNPQLSDGEVDTSMQATADIRLKEDTDSDLSPEGGPKIRKRRKAVRRTKSALETTCELYPRKVERSNESLHNSLPSKLFTQEEETGDLPKSSGIFRPVRSSSKRKNSENRNDEMKIVDLEGLHDGRTSPFKQRIPTNNLKRREPDQKLSRHEYKPKKYSRSCSVDETIIPARPKLFASNLRHSESERTAVKMKKSDLEFKQDSHVRIVDIESPSGTKYDEPDLLADLPSSENVTPRTPKSNRSDSSDLSLGEVFVDIRSNKKKSSKPRPNSASDIGSVPMNFDLKSSSGNGSKSSDMGIGSRIMKFLQNGNSSANSDVPENHSLQSSTVGLDWLFSTDSDSSDEGDSSHPCEHCMSETSSTMTNEGDSTFENSPEHQSKVKDQALDHQTEEDAAKEADELEVMRKQGAIPKNYNKRAGQNIPQPTTSEDTVAGSPSSGELTDPEDFRRKILEILSDPTDNPEQMKKLFKAVIEAKGRRGSRESSSPAGTGKRTSNRQGEESEANRKQGGPEDHETRSSDSKSGTPTENSALLPAPVETTKHERKLARRRRQRRVNRKTKGRPKGASLDSASSNMNHGVHVATSHNDTSEGAVHWFQDENGQWFSYTFSEKSAGTAVTSDCDAALEWMESWSDTSSDSGSTVILDTPKTEEKKEEEQFQYPFCALGMELPGVVNPQDFQQLLAGGRRRLTTCDSSSDSDTPDFMSSKEDKPKHFYKFQLFPKTFLKIRFDRLALLALLDRNLTIIENIIAVIIAIIVGALGALVLSSNFYHDLWVFVFCFIIAGCQYSLVKSVQPDAASPMHGYNRLVVFSRPFYFCVCCGLMLLLDYGRKFVPSNPTYVYGMPFTVASSLLFARDLLKFFILCFPIIFTIGLLPQVNTYMMYLLEQLDMHIFGGNATVSLGASVYCLSRSVVAVALLYGFCFLAIEAGSNRTGCEDKEVAQNAVFSVFSAILVAVSYHLSRSASDPGVLWMLIKDVVFRQKSQPNEDGDLIDPLPDKMKKCVSERLQSDMLVSSLILIFVFAVHVSTAFSSPVLQPVLSDVLYYIAASIGFIIHYFIPMLRKEMPWLCCSHPILANKERALFEVIETPKIMWFEKMYVWLRFFERNIMYPVVFLCALTQSTPKIICKFGVYVGPVLVVICAMKLLRFAFSNTPKQFLVITFTVLFFKYDYRGASETFLIDYFVVSIILSKFCDLILKMKFIITYIAPWQITWGSAFHAFAQPFSVPHSAMLFLQAAVSSFFSTPLNPFLGSAIFFTSYIRPVKFWEKDYNTKRVDHSNTRLSSQLERNPGADDNNLNSIFYEHLTRSLQHSLCGDLMLGRWGNSEQGDCFIMASDYLNALVHVIEMGNGLVTFQLRGLEFRGTYCQQREVEAITEGVEENEGFCCCEPGHLPHFLSLNTAFNQRWLAWEVVVTKYVLEGYSISDNSAATMVQGFDARKILLKYYVMSIIYYTVRSPHLETWLGKDAIDEVLQSTTEDNYVDVDPVFTLPVDDDYDNRLKGVSRNKFCSIYLEWIQHCASRRDKTIDSNKNSSLVSLCYCLSLLGRRALGTATHNNAAAGADFFLYGLHALFKGDFRITSPRDEWVFADMELLRRVVAPAIRMALKLHQDYYLFTDEYEDPETLYNAISGYEQSLVISHEADPQWRNAVLTNTPSLLALRHVFDVEGSDEYKIIMLNKKFLTFRVVKVNRECVRGLWAGQQQELIYLRNRNPERGSIQNAKQALRNMINSSCDQPIGYPIYVSPLTTSYSSTHSELETVIGGEIIIDKVKGFFQSIWKKMRQRCGATCAGSSSGFQDDHSYSVTCTGAASALGVSTRSTLSTPTNQQDIALHTLGNRGSLVSNTSSASKPSALVTLAGFISETTATKDPLSHKVRIMDTTFIFDNINQGRRIDVQWPNDEWKQNGGKNGWHGWVPTKGMEGQVVHKWIPCHRETVKRSHVDKVILLIQVGDKYVPIAEQGVLDLGAEV